MNRRPWRRYRPRPPLCVRLMLCPRCGGWSRTLYVADGRVVHCDRWDCDEWG
jgi:hypothetical protein